MSCDLAWAGISGTVKIGTFLSLGLGHGLYFSRGGRVLGGHEDLRLQMAAGKLAWHSGSSRSRVPRKVLGRTMRWIRLLRSASCVRLTLFSYDYRGLEESWWQD